MRERTCVCLVVDVHAISFAQRVTMTLRHEHRAGEALTVATAGVATSFRILIRDEYGNARAQVFSDLPRCECVWPNPEP